LMKRSRYSIISLRWRTLIVVKPAARANQENTCDWRMVVGGCWSRKRTAGVQRMENATRCRLLHNVVAAAGHVCQLRPVYSQRHERWCWCCVIVRCFILMSHAIVRGAAVGGSKLLRALRRVRVEYRHTRWIVGVLPALLQRRNQLSRTAAGTFA